MDKNPELGTDLVGTWINVDTSFLDRMIKNYACKKCGYVGKVTIITSHPIDTICDSCQRNEKIENLLK